MVSERLRAVRWHHVDVVALLMLTIFWPSMAASCGGEDAMTMVAYRTHSGEATGGT